MSWQDTSLGSHLLVNSECFILSPKSTCVITANACHICFNNLKTAFYTCFHHFFTHEDTKERGGISIFWVYEGKGWKKLRVLHWEFSFQIFFFLLKNKCLHYPQCNLRTKMLIRAQVDVLSCLALFTTQKYSFYWQKVVNKPENISI